MKKLKNKTILVKLLKPVWGLDDDEVKPLIDAVKNGKRSQIEACIRSLKKMLATTKQEDSPYSAKNRAFEAEIKSKIAVLKAILSGKASDWKAASTAYHELENALDSLAASCCDGEEIAEAMFRADAEHAGKLAALCLAQIKSKKTKATKMLLAKEAKRLIDQVGPSLGYDYTESPIFPKDRQDICAVRRVAEDGSNYGFDTIYLVWRGKDGKIRYRELINSRLSKDYIHIRDVKEKNGYIIVTVESGGSYSGSSWKKTFRIPLKKLGLSSINA
jgi:hypothetical protein